MVDDDVGGIDVNVIVWSLSMTIRFALVVMSSASMASMHMVVVATASMAKMIVDSSMDSSLDPSPFASVSASM